MYGMFWLSVLTEPTDSIMRGPSAHPCVSITENCPDVVGVNRHQVFWRVDTVLQTGRVVFRAHLTRTKLANSFKVIILAHITTSQGRTLVVSWLPGNPLSTQ